MIRKILNRLYCLTNWLESKYLKDGNDKLKTTYSSLSPVDNADQDLHYTEALIWALKTRNENDIRNIALTGPYGSGKSSVLKTFQKRYVDNDLHFLNISLATFKEENEIEEGLSKKNKNKTKSDPDDVIRLIELSILQQIFYHAHDYEIPDSRFKKIKSIAKWQIRYKAVGIILFIISLSVIFWEQLPRYILEITRNQSFHQFWTFLISVLLTVAISYTLLYLKKSDNKKKIHFSIPTTLLVFNSFLYGYILFAGLKWFGVIQFPYPEEYNINSLLRYLSLIYVICFTIAFIYQIVKHISRISINKLKFQDAEIEIDDKINKSILNHHLDEIIYFFEVTPYNVVIIEDLDRFRQTEIFTKLREINLLLNNSKKTRHKEITFIYAVRDDMFTDKERTKFFDFIIPIIPVINSSNSSQQLLKKKEKNEYLWSEDLIDSIALFIDDMRLLHNITNEFHLYKHKLTGYLNQDKLLSVLVYKNIFPNDFSQLSNNEGVLFDAINSKREYINNQLETIEKEISLKRDEIRKLESIKIKDVQELRSLYIVAYITHLKNFNAFLINNTLYTVKEVLIDELFEYFISDKTNYRFLQHHHGDRYIITDLPLPKKFQEIEKEVNEDKDYDSRYKEIENWHNNKVDSMKKQIQLLEKQKDTIRISKIKELLTTGSVNIAINEQKQQKLVSVLLRNGYIDEDYIDYISIFYEGSITRSDYDFLLNVKSQIQSDFTYKLYKTEKLIKKINLFDFDKEFILNNNLLDFVLTEPSFHKQRDAIFGRLKDESPLSISFIENFIANGTNTTEFLRILCGSWVNIWNFIEEGSDFTLEKKAQYFKSILEAADIEDIVKIADQSNFKTWIQENTSFLAIIPEKRKIEQILEKLDIFFKDLEFEDSPEDLLEFVYKGGYYSISTKILPKWIKKYGQFNQVNFDTANYSAILESENDELISKVNKEINDYVKNVYLKIDSNINEKEVALTKLLNYENLNLQYKKSIIEKTTTKINDLSQIQDTTVFLNLLSNSKTVATWKNILTAYLELGSITSAIISFLNIESNAKDLSNIKIPKEVDGEDIYEGLLRDLLQNDEIFDNTYELISKASPWCYEDLVIENISQSKVASLINNGIINPTPTSLEKMKEHYEELVIRLIERHPKEYIEQLEDLELNGNNIFSILKSTKLTNAQKNKFLTSLSDDVIVENEESLALISKIVLEDDHFEINESLKEKLLFFNKIQSNHRIMLFNKFNNLLTEERTAEFLTSLGKDYAKITNKKKKALLENNDYNRQLLDTLSGNIISSYSKEPKGLRVNHKRR